MKNSVSKRSNFLFLVVYFVVISACSLNQPGSDDQNSTASVRAKMDAAASGTSYTIIAAPFSFNGAGTNYWELTNIPTYENNWNNSNLTINGVSFLNEYAALSALPALSNGNYYIYYVGMYSYSHFEVGTPTNLGSSSSSSVSSGSSSSKSSSSSVASSSGSSSSSSSLLITTNYNYPVWNAQIVYDTMGLLVQYDQVVYKDQGYAYNCNPISNNGQYNQWITVGSNIGGPMGQGPYIGNGNYCSYNVPPYIIYNDVWGNSNPNTQLLTAWNYNNWNVVSTQPSTSGVKSYANAGLSNVNESIGSLNSFTSAFTVTVPSGGNWEVAYDLWAPTEVMIWMYVSGNVTPIAEGWDSSGNPIPSATNVTVGGYTWNVYHGGNNVVSLVASSSTDGSWSPMLITSGTVDIKAVLNWIVSQGWLSSTGVCGAMQFGFEISGTGGVPMTFTCTNFSMNVQ